MRLISKGLLAIYLVALGFRVFTPRADFLKTTSQFTFGNAGTLHNIFFYESNFQWLGNFLMLMPLAALITIIFPTMKSRYALVVCLIASVLIESIQLYIPGRVSDWKDLLSNALGVALILGAIKLKKQKLVS